MAASQTLSPYLERCCGGIGWGRCRGACLAAAGLLFLLAALRRSWFGALPRRRPSVQLSWYTHKANPFNEVTESSRKKLRWGVSSRVLNFRGAAPQTLSPYFKLCCGGVCSGRCRGGGVAATTPLFIRFFCVSIFLRLFLSSQKYRNVASIILLVSVRGNTVFIQSAAKRRGRHRA